MGYAALSTLLTHAVGRPLVPINFVDYPDESDLNGGTFPNGLYPIPSNMPIETWPHDTGSLGTVQVIKGALVIKKPLSVVASLWP